MDHLELLKDYGLPTVLLIVSWAGFWKMLANKDTIIKDQSNAHDLVMLEKSKAYAKVIAEKDAIIAAKDKAIEVLYEKRHEDSTEHGKRMLTATTGAGDQVRDNTQAATMMTSKLGELFVAVKDLVTEVRGLKK